MRGCDYGRGVQVGLVRRDLGNAAARLRGSWICRRKWWREADAARSGDGFPFFFFFLLHGGVDATVGPTVKRAGLSR